MIVSLATEYNDFTIVQTDGQSILQSLNFDHAVNSVHFHIKRINKNDTSYAEYIELRK